MRMVSGHGIVSDHEVQIVRYVQQMKIIVEITKFSLVSERCVMERDNHSVHLGNPVMRLVGVRVILFHEYVAE